VSFVTSPLSWSILLALLLFGCRHRTIWIRWPLLAAELLLIVLMCPVGANALVDQIESRVPLTPTCSKPDPTVILVLAGGFAWEPDNVEDYGALQTTSLRRLFTGVALWRQTQNAASGAATLVIAGGGPFAIHESDVLARLAEQMGIPASAITTETHSQTTWENAEGLRALSPPPAQHIWVVSSALHLPRAMTALQAFGFSPCAYASDRAYEALEGAGYFLPQSSALRKSEAAIHELLGEAVYRWRSRKAM
jgi:uncharacterized SAM-binding protein YcdF (DUF218 family)